MPQGRNGSRADPPLRAVRLVLLRLHMGDVAAHVGGGLGIGGPEFRLDRAHERLRPRRQRVVDDGEELERRGEADVGDRRLGAADERLPAHIELVEHLERLGDGGHRRLLRRGLGGRVGVARADFAGVLREAERGIGRARDIGIERADDIEHRAVDHRARFQRLRIEVRRGRACWRDTA